MQLVVTSFGFKKRATNELHSTQLAYLAASGHYGRQWMLVFRWIELCKATEAKYSPHLQEGGHMQGFWVCLTLIHVNAQVIWELGKQHYCITMC